MTRSRSGNSPRLSCPPTLRRRLATRYPRRPVAEVTTGRSWATPIRITEHYVRLNYDDKGTRIWRVTTGGEAGDILKLKGQDSIVAEDVMPFAAMTPVIVTHRFFGKSIADLVMDIQRI